jgi:hypothetical protein
VFVLPAAVGRHAVRVAIGAVVLGSLVTCQTALSVQFSPVLAVVPMGAGIFESPLSQNWPPYNV